MTLRALARPLLASAYILDGVEAIRHADEHAERAEPVAPLLTKLSEKVPGIPSDPKTLTRLLGAVQVAAGVALASGKAPRAAAATLALVTVPTAVVANPVWASEGKERQENWRGLLRSAALLGGLLFAAEDRQGKPSLGWRYGNWSDHRADLGALEEGYKSEISELRDSHRAELREVRDTLKAKVKAAKKSGA